MSTLLKRPIVATVLVALSLFFVLVYSGCPPKPGPAILDIEIYSPNYADSISFSIVQKSTGDTIIVVDTLSKVGNSKTINGKYNFSIELPDIGEYFCEYRSRIRGEECACMFEEDVVTFSQEGKVLRTVERKEYGDSLPVLITVTEQGASMMRENPPGGRSEGVLSNNNDVRDIYIEILRCDNCVQTIADIKGSIDPARNMEPENCQDRMTDAHPLDSPSSLETYLSSKFPPTIGSNYYYYLFHFTGTTGDYFLNVSSDGPWYLVSLGHDACVVYSGCGNLGDLDQVADTDLTEPGKVKNNRDTNSDYSCTPRKDSLITNTCYILVFQYEPTFDRSRKIKRPPFCISGTKTRFYRQVVE